MLEDFDLAVRLASGEEREVPEHVSRDEHALHNEGVVEGVFSERCPNMSLEINTWCGSSTVIVTVQQGGETEQVRKCSLGHVLVPVTEETGMGDRGALSLRGAYVCTGIAGSVDVCTTGG